MNDQPNPPAPTGKEVEIVTGDGEIIKGTALNSLPDGYDAATETLAVSLMRAEVDQQIATARAMPRSITRAVQNIITLATLDEESAEECIYALPRAGKDIRGPSVRLAEIVASQWGNCRVGTRVVHVDRFEKYVEAEGVYHDLESNAAITARVRRRISDRKGKLLTEDMIIVTGNAACAIAKRNAILGGVPKAVWRKAYGEVEAVVAGTQQTLASRRERVLKKFAHFGVVPEQIFAALSVPGIEDLTLEHLPTLTGMFAALKSGESNVEEMFPKVAPTTAGKQTIADKLDAVANGGEKSDAGTASSPAAASGNGPSSQEGTARAAAQPLVHKAVAETARKAAEETAVKLMTADASKPAEAEKGSGKLDPTPSTGGEAASSTGSTTQTTAAKPAGLSEAVKTGLRKAHADMMSAMSKKKVEAIFKTTMDANEIKEDDVETAHVWKAAAAIRDAHVKRVGGDGSPAECDAAVRQVIQ